MIKKILLTGFFLFITVVATFFTWRYYGYAHDSDKYKTFLLPRLEIAQVTINSLTYDKTEMTVKALIKNQLPVSFTADSLEYRIFINDKEVMKDHYKKSITLESNNSSLISLPVTIFNKSLVSVLKTKEREHIDSVEYRMDVSFFTRIIFKRQFDIDVKKFLPLIHIPEIKVAHFKVGSIDFKGATIDLTVSVKNENIFEIKAKNVAYEVSIENNKWVKGVIPGLTDIPAKGTSDFKVPVTLTFKEAGKALFDLLKKSDKLNYKLRLAFNIDGGNNMIKNSKVNLESEGTVRSVMKIAKKIKKTRHNK